MFMLENIPFSRWRATQNHLTLSRNHGRVVSPLDHRWVQKMLAYIVAFRTDQEIVCLENLTPSSALLDAVVRWCHVVTTLALATTAPRRRRGLRILRTGVLEAWWAAWIGTRRVAAFIRRTSLPLGKPAPLCIATCSVPCSLLGCRVGRWGPSWMVVQKSSLGASYRNSQKKIGKKSNTKPELINKKTGIRCNNIFEYTFGMIKFTFSLNSHQDCSVVLFSIYDQMMIAGPLGGFKFLNTNRNLRKQASPYFCKCRERGILRQGLTFAQKDCNKWGKSGPIR